MSYCYPAWLQNICHECLGPSQTQCHTKLHLLLKIARSGLQLLSLDNSRFEPHSEKTNVSHMRKQRPRSAYREADQSLCFRYLDSTIPVLPKYKISSL